MYSFSSKVLGAAAPQTPTNTVWVCFNLSANAVDIHIRRNIQTRGNVESVSAKVQTSPKLFLEGGVMMISLCVLNCCVC